jgi:hypothetical protein
LAVNAGCGNVMHACTSLGLNPSDAASKTALSVASVAGSRLQLNVDGTKGPITSGAGQLGRDINGFVKPIGDDRIDRCQTTVALVDNSTVVVDLLHFGVREVSAFAALNGGADESPGLAPAPVVLAMVPTSNQADASPLHGVSMQAWADTAPGVGAPVCLTVAGCDGLVSIIPWGCASIAIGASAQDQTARSPGSGSTGRCPSNPPRRDISDVIDLRGVAAVSAVSAVCAFAGAAAVNPRAIGLQLVGRGFALAPDSDAADNTSQWTTLQAWAELAPPEGAADRFTPARAAGVAAITLFGSQGQTLVDVGDGGAEWALDGGASTTLQPHLDGSKGPQAGVNGHLNLSATGLVLKGLANSGPSAFAPTVAQCRLPPRPHKLQLCRSPA